MIVAEGPLDVLPRICVPILQWGRNLIVAEGQKVVCMTVDKTTSMGPQLDSCGRTAMAKTMAASTENFNGAAT